jgi:hypothetical protein
MNNISPVIIRRNKKAQKHTISHFSNRNSRLVKTINMDSAFEFKGKPSPTVMNVAMNMFTGKSNLDMYASKLSPKNLKEELQNARRGQGRNYVSIDLNRNISDLHKTSFFFEPDTTVTEGTNDRKDIY